MHQDSIRTIFWQGLLDEGISLLEVVDYVLLIVVEDAFYAHVNDALIFELFLSRARHAHNMCDATPLQCLPAARSDVSWHVYARMHLIDSVFQFSSIMSFSLHFSIFIF